MGVVTRTAPLFVGKRTCSGSAVASPLDAMPAPRVASLTEQSSCRAGGGAGLSWVLIPSFPGARPWDHLEAASAALAPTQVDRVASVHLHTQVSSLQSLLYFYPNFFLPLLF